VSLICGCHVELGKARADTATVPRKGSGRREREGVHRAAETGRCRVPTRRALADRLVVVRKLL
jgi:hypothetical protein